MDIECCFQAQLLNQHGEVLEVLKIMSSLYIYCSKKLKRSEDSMETVWQSVSSRPKALDVMSKWTLSGESTAFFQTQFGCGFGKSCKHLDNLVKLKHDVLVFAMLQPQKHMALLNVEISYMVQVVSCSSTVHCFKTFLRGQPTLQCLHVFHL